MDYQATALKRNPYVAQDAAKVIMNSRLFYFLIILFVILQAMVVYLEIESRMFIAFCFFSIFILFFFSLNKPEIAIMALIIYIPFSKIIVGNITTGVNFTNMLVVSTLVGWFISHQSKDEKFLIPTSLNFPLLLFFIIGLISLILGSYQLVNIEGESIILTYWRWITPLLMYIIVVNNIHDKDSIKKALKAILITTIVVALITLRQYQNLGVISTWEKARISSVAGNPNALGAFMSQFGPLFLGLFVYEGRRMRSLIYLIPFVLCARATHVTFSRGSWLAFGVASFLVGIFSRSKKLIFLVILLVIILAIKPDYIPESIRARFDMTFTKKDSYIEEPLEDTLEKSAADRIIIWRGAMNMIKTHPILGIGYGSFPYFIMQYSKIEAERDAHNTYLRIAAEMGIPALLIFLILILLIFINTFWVFRHTSDKFFKGCSLGFLGGIIGLVVSCMFGSRMNSLEIAGQFWIIAALMQRLKMIITQETSVEEKQALEPNEA